MIRNLFITALRNLRKNKFFSALNILGLGVGMGVFLLIAQYVHFERSYENFIPDKENIYRVKLTTIDGRQIFSEEVSILIAGENSLYVYPNPAEGGTEINVIVNNEEPMLLYLFDSCGRLARKTGDFGTIKQMSTAALSAGIYFLKAVKPNGQILTSKIMVR